MDQTQDWIPFTAEVRRLQLLSCGTASTAHILAHRLQPPAEVRRTARLQPHAEVRPLQLAIYSQRQKYGVYSSRPQYGVCSSGLKLDVYSSGLPYGVYSSRSKYGVYSSAPEQPLRAVEQLPPPPPQTGTAENPHPSEARRSTILRAEESDACMPTAEKRGSAHSHTRRAGFAREADAAHNTCRTKTKQPDRKRTNRRRRNLKRQTIMCMSLRGVRPTPRVSPLLHIGHTCR